MLTRFLSIGRAQVDLSWPTQEFYAMCHQWDQYDEEIHCVKTKLVRKYVLASFYLYSVTFIYIISC